MSTVIPYVLFRINEIRDSSIAALYTDSSGGTTITPDAGVTQAWNDAKNLACRSYFPVEGLFTATYANGQYSTDYTGFAGIAGDANFPTPTGSTPWWAFRSLWTPAGGAAASLTFAAEEIIQRFYPEYQNPAVSASTGVPSNWYRTGVQGVGLWAIPAASGTCTIQAFRIPEDVTPTGTVAWISGGDWRILAVEAAILIINKASNDAQIQQRLPALLAERNELVMNKWESIPSVYRAVRGDGVVVPFSTPPVMGGGAGK
jgi:hypothetical protein